MTDDYFPMNRKSIFLAAALVSMTMVPSCNETEQRMIDPISEAIAQVSQDSITSYINTLVGFHTRHTQSTQTDPNVGIGAAVNYLSDLCTKWTTTPQAPGSEGRGINLPKAKVEVLHCEAGRPQDKMDRALQIPNVMVTLPGTEGSKEIILMAHIDTRVNDLADSTTFAPGANDDGSGLSLLLEAVRILSQTPMRQTVKCLFVSGEEQNLIGSSFFAQKAVDEDWPVLAVLNNDMIGNAEASGTGLHGTDKVRVFSDSPSGEDSAPRQLARYIKETAEQYVPGHEVKLIYRNDRYRRGGDHSSFLNKGFTAVRISEYYENYDRTHQVVRNEDGIAYGDVISGVDIPYLEKNIKVNLAAVMNLAMAPSTPTGARIANANALANTTILEWDPVTLKDGSLESGVTYEILIRETDQSEWEVYEKAPAATSLEKQSIELGISKDNYFYAVRSVSADGHPSLPAVCR